MKRGQIYSPGGYLLDCMDCDKLIKITNSDRQKASTILQGMGWAYFRGWYCPECARANGVASENEDTG